MLEEKKYETINGKLYRKIGEKVMDVAEIMTEIEELRNLLKGRAEEQIRNMEELEDHGDTDRAKQSFNRAYAYNKSAQSVEFLIRHIEESFNNYYFTFGSWEKFPYQHSYLVVKANSTCEAIKKFKEKYPNTEDDCLCCSDYYTETQWHEYAESYYSNPPEEIIY